MKSWTKKGVSIHQVKLVLGRCIPQRSPFVACFYNFDGFHPAKWRWNFASSFCTWICRCFCSCSLVGGEYISEVYLVLWKKEIKVFIDSLAFNLGIVKLLEPGEPIFKLKLVCGWTTQLKICASQIGSFPQGSGEKKMKPPPGKGSKLHDVDFLFQKSCRVTCRWQRCPHDGHNIVVSLSSIFSIGKPWDWYNLDTWIFQACKKLCLLNYCQKERYHKAKKIHTVSRRSRYVIHWSCGYATSIWEKNPNNTE